MPRPLVVDDDPPVRQVVHDYFSLKGYDVIVATDGGRAFAACARSAPISCCWTSPCRTWTA